jgi:hypothetical protein
LGGVLKTGMGSFLELLKMGVLACLEWLKSVVLRYVLYVFFEIMGTLNEVRIE